MPENEYQYIFGPIYSWRLGVSVGIDPLSQSQKICSFDCEYCQLARTDCLQSERMQWVATNDILNELKSFPVEHVDYYTFSGRGEPTLALNLGELIQGVKTITKGKVAVISNSTLIDRVDVQKDLLLADCVLLKLDAWNQESLQRINQSSPDVHFSHIVDGIKKFRCFFKGILAIQIMFVEANKSFAPQIARVVRDLNPDEVQLNTPLRPSNVQPISKKDMWEIKKFFADFNAKTVYEKTQKDIKPLHDKQTKLRHGLSS